VTASTKKPNTYQGKVVDGGIVWQNRKPTSANSPAWSGRVYVSAPGWHRVSMWYSAGKQNQMNMRLRDMTDEEVDRFIPDAPVYRKPAPSRQYADESQTETQRNGADMTDTDIPF